MLLLEAVLSPAYDSPLDLSLLLIYHCFKVFYELYQLVRFTADLILNYSIDSFTWIGRKWLWWASKACFLSYRF